MIIMDIEEYNVQQNVRFSVKPNQTIYNTGISLGMAFIRHAATDRPASISNEWTSQTTVSPTWLTNCQKQQKHVVKF